MREAARRTNDYLPVGKAPAPCFLSPLLFCCETLFLAPLQPHSPLPPSFLVVVVATDRNTDLRRGGREGRERRELRVLPFPSFGLICLLLLLSSSCSTLCSFVVEALASRSSPHNQAPQLTD